MEGEMVSRLVFLPATLSIALGTSRPAEAALYLAISVDPEEPRALEPVRVKV
jgi:hypothetical protein